MDAPLSIKNFKKVSVFHVVEMSYFKLISGKIAAGTEGQNTSRNVTEKIGQIYLMNGIFKEEVGIRDLTVTGVQTCALPIFTVVAGLTVIVAFFLFWKSFPQNSQIE